MAAYLTHAMADCGRIELRHEHDGRWSCGLFDDLGALRQTIDRLKDAGNLYTTINAPFLIRAPNAMTGPALRDNDIAMVVRLPFDFDPVRPVGLPSTDAELRHAIVARDRLVAALLGLGWPQPLTAVSGNGGHALYRCRLRATRELAEQMRTIYAGLKVDFRTDAVLFDSTTHNPSRVWRLYGTMNRKGSTPTPTRPHRVALASIPARWQAVAPRQIEALANAYARRRPETQPARERMRINGAGDFATLDVRSWFAAHALYKRPLVGGKHAVGCPWSAEHSTVDHPDSTSTVVWQSEAGLWPTFHCSHAHCQGRDIRSVMALLGDADRFCASTWRATR